MAILELYCPKCNSYLEVVATNQDFEDFRCPECKNPELRISKFLGSKATEQAGVLSHLQTEIKKLQDRVDALCDDAIEDEEVFH